MILALTNKRGKKDEGVSSWESKKMMYKIFFKHLTVKSFELILGRHFSSLGMKMYLISLMQITKSYSKWQKSQTKMNNGQEGKEVGKLGHLGRCNACCGSEGGSE